MLRTALFALALVAAPALAQDYTGTYTAKHPSSGDKIVLELQQEADHVSGTLSGNGNTFEVDADVVPEGIVGEVTGKDAWVFIVAQLTGTQLIVQLFEPGPTGAPNPDSVRQMRMVRE